MNDIKTHELGLGLLQGRGDFNMMLLLDSNLVVGLLRFSDSYDIPCAQSASR